MKRTTWMAGTVMAVAAISIPYASAQGRQSQSQSKGGSAGRLIQVAPLAPGEEAREFSPDEWLARLTDLDLDLREKNFAELVALARRDDRARAWLRERATDTTDTTDPELTWTARLALREVERRGASGANKAAGPLLRGPTFSLQDDAFDDFLGRVERLRGRIGRGFSTLQVPPAPHGSSQSRSVAIEETPDGVEVVVTETVDGEETTREYEAESLEALLEAHPELEGEIGNGSLRLHMGPNAPLLDVDGMRLEFEQLFEGLDLLRRGAPIPEPGSARPIRTDVLGVYVAAPSPALSTQLGLAPGTGLVVHGTMPGTIAHVLGIARGNVLVELNGNELRSLEQISQILGTRPSDGEVTVVWYDGFGDRRRQTWMPAEAPRPIESPREE